MSDFLPLTTFAITAIMLTSSISLSSSSVGNTVDLAAVTLPGATQPMAGQDLRKAKMARYASFNITPTSVAIQRQVSSAPSSPRREPTGERHYEFCSFLLSLYYSRVFFFFMFMSDNWFTFLTLQVSQASLWIIPERLQATMQCVNCSLETALSELILTHIHTQPV